MPILPGIIKAVLEADDSPIRFERFCLEVCSKLQGVVFLPTSPARDLGRNGRSLSPKHVLCATLEKEIGPKIENDIQRLKETTEAYSITYCCSKSLTEEKCGEIEAKIRKLDSGIKSIEILGQFQLIALAEKEEQITRTCYGAEIKNVEQALLRQPSISSDAEVTGLRLALLIQGVDDSNALRKELAARLILEALYDQGAMSAAKLSQIITSQLHLPCSISLAYMASLLDEMKADNFIIYDNDVAQLNENGKKRIIEVPEKAGIKLLEGRLAVRNAIKMLSGHNLTGELFDQFWNIFQDGIAELFYSHGLAIVQMVRSILKEETATQNKIEVVFPIEKLANRISFLFDEPTQKEEIKQAIKDMFLEKESEAFQWLAQICGIYVMLCSLGFETLSNKQVRNILLDFGLVPDSDVILSLLCEGESNHDTVVKIINGWRALGGKLLSSTPILEEVAYHAWISEYDFSAIENERKALSVDYAMHVIDNTFVRSFRKISKEKTARKYWNHYISGFRGGNSRDYTKILEILRNDFGLLQLPNASNEYDDFRDSVKQFILQRISEESRCKVEKLDPRTHDKAMRDGELFAAVYAERNSIRAISKPPNISIVSSSRMLKQADEIFREELGDPDAVLSTAAMSFLLTLCPDVEMGLSNLRSVLFDSSLAGRLNPIQRYAYRVIAASSQWDLPWSKRSTLARELSKILISQAKARGSSVDSITKRVLESKDPEFSARVVYEALGQMAVSSIDQNEVLKLRAQVRALQTELANVHKQGSTKSRRTYRRSYKKRV